MLHVHSQINNFVMLFIVSILIFFLFCVLQIKIDKCLVLSKKLKVSGAL